MQVPQSSENLATAWAEAVAAAVFAPLAVATKATAAAASMWNGTLAQPVEAVESAAGLAEREPQTAHWFAPEQLSKPRIAAVSASPRSWYRAPYRSAFDPLFWLQPGHPVDHLPETVASAMQLGVLSHWAGSRAWSGPAMNGLFPTMFAGQSAPWVPASWNAWAFAMPAATARTMPKRPSNVIDFNSTYSAYRTAGGHAAAQIIRAPVAEVRTARPARQDENSAMLRWPLGLMMMPWLSSNRR